MEEGDTGVCIPSLPTGAGVRWDRIIPCSIERLVTRVVIMAEWAVMTWDTGLVEVVLVYLVLVGWVCGLGLIPTARQEDPLNQDAEEDRSRDGGVVWEADEGVEEGVEDVFLPVDLVTRIQII